jgi:aspartate carbamoyltransferase catalytic subunit
VGKMRHLLSPLDLTVKEIDGLIEVAEDIKEEPKKSAHVCDGKR